MNSGHVELELNNTNMFTCSISGGILRYTRSINSKICTLVITIEDKIDAWNKLSSISKLDNNGFLEFVELQKRHNEQE